MLVGLSEEYMENKMLLDQLTRRVCNEHLKMSSGWSSSVHQASVKDLVITFIKIGFS